LAPEGKAIPEGSEIIFTGAADKIGADKAPPKPSGVLRLGSKGKDVRVLQARLKELGYYKGEVDGIFGDMTDKAARRFQADHFGAAEADGKAGPRTWGRLWGTDATPPAAPVPFAPQVPKPGKNYLRLVRTGKRDKYKCDVLSLKYIKDGLVKDALEVCSGAPGKQIFRKGVNSVSKSLEPLPEGKWSIQDIKWADAPDIYDGKVFSTGIGPVSTPLRYAGPGATGRSAIEVHIDWNRRHNNPGTAGCVGIYSVADYRRFVEWLRDTNPRDLYVDWGLGTCPQTP
jgi:lysozyme